MRLPREARFDRLHVAVNRQLDTKDDGVTVYVKARYRSQIWSISLPVLVDSPTWAPPGEGTGSRHYPNAEKVAARLAVIATKRRVGDYLRHTVGKDASAKSTLEWHFDQVRYKGQEVVERRYGNFKGPIAVAPVFLKNNRRIEALLTVICLALLIFCLVERQVRRAIAPGTTMTGFPGRPKIRPTGRLIFQALSRFVLVPACATGPPVVPAPPELAGRILDLLSIDPTTTR